VGLKVFIGDERGISYEFELFRKVTFVRGDSGTGKTTLYSLVKTKMDRTIGIRTQCKYEILAYDDMRMMRKESRLVVFIDEDTLRSTVNTSVLSKEIENSRNYWVIISRYDYPEINYSMDAIYEVYGNKKHKMRKIYKYGNRTMEERPSRVFTEDSKSGKKLAEIAYGKDVVRSVGGNGNIAEVLRRDIDNGVSLYIVDAEAFGPYIKKVVEIMEDRKLKNKFLLAPPSTEFIILNNGMFHTVVSKIKEFMNNVDNTVRIYSRERFYTEALVGASSDTPASYVKERLKGCYYANCCSKGKIIKGKCKLYCKVDKIKKYREMFNEMEGKGNASRIL
jgi:CRISPR/Cas system CSM-associated protein Csm2 small subunit